MDRENLTNHLRLFGLLILKPTGGEPNSIGGITLTGGDLQTVPR